MKLSTRIFDWLAIAAILVAVAFSWATQSGAYAPAGDAGSGNIAVRVEIQRYMGYEILPVRYLSLPYDITMNANEQLAALDIGFVLLLFVPILVLLGLRDKPILQVLVIASCLFLLIISTSNGYITGQNFELIKPELAALEQYLSATHFSDAPTGVIAANFYLAFSSIYSGIKAILSHISGNKDAITYPLLLAFFALFFFISAQRFTDNKLHEKSLLVFVLTYSFFFLLLSAGIIWYGFLVFPVLTALVFWSMSHQEKLPGVPNKIAVYGFYGMIGLAILMGFTYRISNLKLNILNTDPVAGKRIFDPIFVKYHTGEVTHEQVTDAFYPQLSKALQMMNQETNSLIYNVGTRFNFFIEGNDKRIYKDNQLDLWHLVQTKYPNKQQINTMLKNSGFGYIMVDFNTPTGDNTPEQALVNRYKNLMLLFYQNPGMELIATNRIIKNPATGKQEYGVFGEAINTGSYAIFRIK